jgi:hypothetical protein
VSYWVIDPRFGVLVGVTLLPEDAEAEEGGRDRTCGVN